MRAFGLGREEIARDLLNAGGDPLLKDDQGLTALDYARMNKAESMLALLSNGEAAQDSDDLGDL